MIDSVIYLFGVLFGIFGPAIVLAILIAIPNSKEK